ncbi:MAG TPA: HEAT repeat domain-containing protein, partial [Kofleriaceae bacterium]|nr:HEAT repeat domain-containing protein [Kofleriaceae bacterium]
LGVLATTATSAAPSVDTARSVLASKEMSPGARAEARERLQRAFAVDADGAAKAAAELAGDSDAPNEERVFALELLLDEAQPSSYAAITESIDAARRAGADAVRAAALPLYARMDPKQGAAELVGMLEDKKLPTEMRVAMALAWGEIAKNKDRAAQGALEQLIKDPNVAVRAAAARAYGHVGRLAQGPLEKMIKADVSSVQTGAAIGLANSADAGASAGGAAGGIEQLWKQKGRERRAAAEVYATMARRHPKAVFDYLRIAVTTKEDAGLHPIGARGMCAAMAGGHKPAQTAIEGLADDPSPEVRRIAINCVADNPKFTKTAAAVAIELKKDPSVDIKTEAARVLAHLAADDKGAPPGVAAALTQLVADTSRDVRVIALSALEAMGANAPKEAAAALVKAFDHADPGEKQALLGAAKAIGAGELVQPALLDPSAEVRVAALQLALDTGTGVSAAIGAALTDSETSVRRDALRHLAEAKSLDKSAIDNILALASRDPDPGIANEALIAYAHLGDPADVKKALRAALQSPSEAERARAASACIGLVDRKSTKDAIELLDPLLDDPSHDVRVALLRPLAAAQAAGNEAELLGKMLGKAEDNVMRRLVAAAAFIEQVRTSKNPEAAEQKAGAVLDGIAGNGSPMVKRTAALTAGLIKNKTDGLGFLATLVP